MSAAGVSMGELPDELSANSGATLHRGVCKSGTSMERFLASPAPESFQISAILELAMVKLEQCAMQAARSVCLTIMSHQIVAPMSCCLKYIVVYNSKKHNIKKAQAISETKWGGVQDLGELKPGRHGVVAVVKGLHNCCVTRAGKLGTGGQAQACQLPRACRCEDYDSWRDPSVHQICLMVQKLQGICNLQEGNRVWQIFGLCPGRYGSIWRKVASSMAQQAK